MAQYLTKGSPLQCQQDILIDGIVHLDEGEPAQLELDLGLEPLIGHQALLCNQWSLSSYAVVDVHFIFNAVSAFGAQYSSESFMLYWLNVLCICVSISLKLEERVVWHLSEGRRVGVAS